MADKVTSSSIVFAVDTSGSMDGAISSAIQQTMDFAGLYVGPEAWQYRVGLIDFGGPAEMTQTITQDRGAILSGLQDLLDNGNGGAGEDTAHAIVTASQMLSGSTGRKIIIVFTDEEFQAYNNTYSDALVAVGQQNIEVYFIGYADSVTNNFLFSIGMSDNPMSVTSIGEYPIEEIISAIKGREGSGIARIGDTLNDGNTIKIVANTSKVKMYINNREVAIQGAYFKSQSDPLISYMVKAYYNGTPILKHGNSNQSMTHWITTSSTKVLYNASEEEQQE